MSPATLSVLAVVLVGTLCYAFGAALQHQAASTAPGGDRLRPSLFLRLVRRPRWLLGVAANSAGVGLHLWALHLAPLGFVQPLGVMTIAFAVPAGAIVARRRPTRPEVVGAVVVSGGLALLMTTLHAPHVEAALSLLDVLPVVGVVLAGLAIAAVVVRRTTGAVRTVVLATGTGIAFGITSALLRPLSHGFTTDGIAPTVLGMLVAVLAVVGIGMLLEQSAYQTGRLGLAVAVITVSDPIAGVLVGSVFLHQPASLGSPLVAAAAIALVVAGVAVLGARQRTATGHVPATPLTAALPEPTGTGRRILIGADTYPPHVSGAAFFARRLAHGLAERGHEVHVVAPSGDGPAGLEHDGRVIVHRVRSVPAPFYADMHLASPLHLHRSVRHVVDRIRPDVVHVQSHLGLGRALARLATARRLPLVASNHWMPENMLPHLRLPAPLARGAARLAWRDLGRVLATADAVTTPTERAAAPVREVVGGRRTVEAVSNGVDLSRFSPATSPRRPSRRRRILFVGRLDPEKHVDELIAALPVVRLSVDAELVVAGTGGARAALEARAVERGVAPYVRFLGYVPDEDLPDLYRSADVFAMPGTAELQSLVTLEAMASGLPVVLADAMALPHLCRPGSNGFLHPPHDVAAIGERLAAVLADDAERARMGLAAAAVAAGHDEQVSLARYEAIYGEVTAAPAPGSGTRVTTRLGRGRERAAA